MNILKFQRRKKQNFFASLLVPLAASAHPGDDLFINALIINHGHKQSDKSSENQKIFNSEILRFSISFRR